MEIDTVLARVSLVRFTYMNSWHRLLFPLFRDASQGHVGVLLNPASLLGLLSPEALTHVDGRI